MNDFSSVPLAAVTLRLLLPPRFVYSLSEQRLFFLSVSVSDDCDVVFILPYRAEGT